MVDVSGKEVRVELFEGEVLVHRINEEKNSVKLLPDEFLVYNSLDRKLVKQEKTVVKSKPVVAKEVKVAKVVEDKSVLKFRNKNLSTILDELAMQYKVKINYPTQQAKGFRINMVIDTTQQIEVILRNIDTVCKQS